jgi:SAM-dependent methyltransferase
MDSAPWVHKVRRLRHSIASSGLGRTLADIVAQKVAYRPADDHSFDRKYGTETSGSREPSELGIADPALREKAILYLPSPASVTRWMLQNVGIEHARCSFVDLGCGKGRVLLVASEFPFARIVGVDISTDLCAVARRNAETFQPPTRRCRDIQVENVDATTFEFPEGDLLIHLYHPFSPELTYRILERLGASLRERPRRVVVAYLLYTGAMAEVEAMFARVPWLTRARYEHSVTGQYDWLFYSSHASS